MDELFLYDRDNGLFKQILKQSTVMQGRYFISTNGGSDLNSSNIDAIILDTLKGMVDAEQKYPCVICIPPYSTFSTETGTTRENIYFSLFFICTTGYTGQNKVKQPHPSTMISTHHVWQDWKDMKECATNFMEVFDKVTRKLKIGLLPVCNFVNVDIDSMQIQRLSKLNNDELSGVHLSFRSSLAGDNCDLNDYPPDVLDIIVLPPTSIHPLHLH